MICVQSGPLLVSRQVLNWLTSRVSETVRYCDVVVSGVAYSEMTGAFLAQSLRLASGVEDWKREKTRKRR